MAYPTSVSQRVRKIYRSRDGRSYFTFQFVPRGRHIDVHCSQHPPLNGRDPNVHKTHLYRSGKVCFVAGQEPRSQRRAEQLAQQWAEYFLEYRRTGVAQE